MVMFIDWLFVDCSAGTREVHNKLEKNRRAHLRECFEFLRKQLPAIDDKKLSNLGILKSALRYIQVIVHLHLQKVQLRPLLCVDARNTKLT